MKLAYKGFDSHLSCKGERFEIGITYTKKCKFSVPRLCSPDGFHYCDSLEGVYKFYRKISGNNRYCLIEILGPFSSDTEKSITTSFRIIKEITNLSQLELSELVLHEAMNYDTNKLARDENEKNIKERLEKEEREKELKVLLRKEIVEEDRQKELKRNEAVYGYLNLELVKELQIKNPTLIIVGSASLFLNGIVLDRYYNNDSDLDFIIPYYIPLESNEKITISEDEPLSGNSFDLTTTISYNGKSIKADILINPKQRWEYIEYKGFKYKVGDIISTWKAKLDYALQKGESSTKHRNDFYEAIGKKVLEEDKQIIVAPPAITKTDELPW